MQALAMLLVMQLAHPAYAGVLKIGGLLGSLSVELRTAVALTVTDINADADTTAEQTI